MRIAPMNVPDTGRWPPRMLVPPITTAAIDGEKIGVPHALICFGGVAREENTGEPRRTARRG